MESERFKLMRNTPVDRPVPLHCITSEYMCIDHSRYELCDDLFIFQLYSQHTHNDVRSSVCVCALRHQARPIGTALTAHYTCVAALVALSLSLSWQSIGLWNVSVCVPHQQHAPFSTDACTSVEQFKAFFRAQTFGLSITLCSLSP